MEIELGEMSALKYICPHAEHACCNMSTSVPVSSTQSLRLLFKVCRNCVNSTLILVSALQANTSHLKRTDKLVLECSDWQTFFAGLEFPIPNSDEP